MALMVQKLWLFYKFGLLVELHLEGSATKGSSLELNGWLRSGACRTLELDNIHEGSIIIPIL